MLPVFVTVRLSAELAIPVGQVPKANGLGLIVAVLAAGTLFPLSATGEFVTVVPVAVIVTVPVYEDPVGGVEGATNTMLIVQVAPEANVVPQPFVPMRANGAVTTTAMPVAPAPP